MAPPRPELRDLLRTLDPQAPLAERHLWLMQLLDWVRGQQDEPQAAVARVRMLLDIAEPRPDWLGLWHQWWARFLSEVDATPLLADLGFASRSAFLAELSDRLRRKLIPPTPETTDLRELFPLLFPSEFDARWLRALDKPTLERLRRTLFDDAAEGSAQAYTLRTLLNALAYAISQISAAGQSAELRTRMAAAAQREQPFVGLPIGFEALRQAVLTHGRDSAPALVALAQLREQLDACRAAAATVYAHLEAHGISVHIEFQLRQLRQRIIRVKALLLCLETDEPAQATAQLLSHLVRVHQDSRSVRALVRSSTELLAAKVTERNAETGEHYIAHDGPEYLRMLGAAAGGGAVMAVTTCSKLLIMALGLSAFWGGVAAGLNYAISFVVIMLLGWTVATKQPAMTAPTLAARLKSLDSPAAHEDFVTEVVYLLRTQFVAIVGNVLLVLLLAFALALAIQALGWGALVDEHHARQILADHHALGRTIPFAAITGALLFASSLIAGWVENWFVLHRLDSVIAHHPRSTRLLGAERARRWGHYWGTHISGWAANVSLGLLLGVMPPIVGFFGLPMEVRHVTLVSGQIAVAAQHLGPAVWQEPALWWAAGGIVVTGALDVGVSFYLAFRLALTAQNVAGVDRRRIYQAMGRRLLRDPRSFVLPVRIRPIADEADAEPAHKPGGTG
jgi:site-specific recombinase